MIWMQNDPTDPGLKKSSGQIMNEEFKWGIFLEGEKIFKHFDTRLYQNNPENGSSRNKSSIVRQLTLETWKSKK